MTNYNILQKIIRKGKKIEQPSNLLEELQRLIYQYYFKTHGHSMTSFKEYLESPKFPHKQIRGIYFLTQYYGLQGKALTLDAIGKLASPTLTRERVRQIIDDTITQLKSISLTNNVTNTLLEKSNINTTGNVGAVSNQYYFNMGISQPATYPTDSTESLSSLNYNSYNIIKDMFLNLLKEDKFISFDDLVQKEYFKGFAKNTKGLIAFLNDCDIKQISYRKNYYFYVLNTDKKSIIHDIQKANKNIRRNETLSKMSLKSKTVTYIPNEVREFLLEYSKKKEINLNPLYEKILTDFIDARLYEDLDYQFIKTQSWKARKGRAEWKQIGLYINKDIFENVIATMADIKDNYYKSVSLMSFISQSLIWFYDRNKLNM